MDTVVKSFAHRVRDAKVELLTKMKSRCDDSDVDITLRYFEGPQGRGVVVVAIGKSRGEVDFIKLYH